MAPASLWQRVAADNELLGLGDLEFDPGAAASATFIDSTSSFGDQPLEAEFLSNREQFVLTAVKLTREPDILRSFFKQLSQEFASGTKRL